MQLPRNFLENTFETLRRLSSDDDDDDDDTLPLRLMATHTKKGFVIYAIQSTVPVDSVVCQGIVFSLTNRFHVAVRLFSNRSQMTSKCGKNKKSGTRDVAECVTDVLTTFSRLL